MKDNTPHDPIMSRKEAAAYIKRKPRTLAWWDCRKRFDLKPVKIGTKMVYYRKSVLDQFLAGQLTPE